MLIPDFDEFMASLDPDATARALAEIMGNHVYQFDSADPKNWVALLNEAHQHAVTVATRLMVFYLRQYHEWLRQQL